MANQRPSDPALLVAALLCLINPLAAMTRSRLDADLLGIVSQLISSLMLVPIFSLLPLAAALAVRQTRSQLAKWLLVTLSLVCVADYVRFLCEVDLASSSTAGLSLIFYPMMRQAIWFFPLAGIALTIGYLLGPKPEQR